MNYNDAEAISNLYSKNDKNDLLNELKQNNLVKSLVSNICHMNKEKLTNLSLSDISDNDDQ